MRTLATLLLAATYAILFTSPALADKGKLSDSDRAEILALTEKVETAIINKDLKLLQECCDPWDGLWIDIGLSAGWFNPSPIIYYGWVQIPEMLGDDHLYFLGNADGSGHPVYGRAPEIVWRGRWGIVEPDGECRQTVNDIRWPTEDGLSLADIMLKNDGQELDAFTREPSNMVFYWEDEYHFMQYFHVGAQEPYDNDFWFLLFGRDPNSGHSQREWCLKGIAHLDGWGI